MKQLVRFCLATAIASFASIGAANPLPEAVLWQTVGGWDVSYYPAAKGCQAFALFEDETAFFIGIDDTDGRRSLNVTLVDKDWTQIDDGVEYNVQVKFGPNPTWSLAMDGQIANGYPALSIHIDIQSHEAELFVREFRKESEMTWMIDGSDLARLTLKGSHKAYDEVMACQSADRTAPTIATVKPDADDMAKDPIPAASTSD